MDATQAVDPLAALLGTGLNVGAFGLVAWLVKHTFSHTIPRLAEGFEKALTEHRVEFATALQEQRHEFLVQLNSQLEEQRAERRECIARVDELRQELTALIREIRNR